MEESDLAKKDHWDSVFDTEIKNFEECGDTGEVWFGEHVQKKAVEYFNQFYEDKSIKVLDIGCGNAAFLIAMQEECGFTDLTGVDYSEKSVELAQKIVEKIFGQDHNIKLKQGDAFDLEDKDEYDAIHDKGTFDVILMMKEDNNFDYVKAMHYRMKKEETSRMIITSCNCTADELDEIFLQDGYFDKVEEIKGYKTFKFGGIQGQVVSTCVYKPNRKE